MTLLPASPLGSAQRKLRTYLVEIGRLRNEGYTIAVILEALRARGVLVGWSTVQREIKRLESACVTAAPATVKRPAPAPSPSPVRVTPDKLDQKSYIDEFFDSVDTNPLFRKKKL